MHDAWIIALHGALGLSFSLLTTPLAPEVPFSHDDPLTAPGATAHVRDSLQSSSTTTCQSLQMLEDAMGFLYLREAHHLLSLIIIVTFGLR